MVEADFTLSVKKIIAQKIKVGPASMEVKLKAGKLVANLKCLVLYGGRPRCS